MIYLANAFSINMLDFNSPNSAPEVRFVPIKLEQVRKRLCDNNFTSAIGHVDTAAVVANLLDLSVQANRITVKLGPYDSLIVAQYNGPRLQEGATTLPADASITFLRCTINYW